MFNAKLTYSEASTFEMHPVKCRCDANNGTPPPYNFQGQTLKAGKEGY